MKNYTGMNDRRLWQCLIPIHCLFYHLRNDKTAWKITNYVALVFGKVIPKDRAFKIAKRLDKSSYEIMKLLAEKDIVSGHKLTRVLFYLTEKIFEVRVEKPLTKEEIFILQKSEFLLNYVLYLEHKHRYNHLASEDDFEALDKSAKKQAMKIFERFYEL